MAAGHNDQRITRTATELVRRACQSLSNDRLWRDTTQWSRFNLYESSLSSPTIAVFSAARGRFL
ncbi:hypothetical protein DOTSEDRAFT_75109 [Dothistroma septosporum NZE10]|uniref:Uncharacterized protein n=1 Tax=Dothistroma septosporum (strain NZE10 / CBS 128990) TaxID=675120 RepID=M2WJZ2_DOTSN|nr:hypothetical protein DOTSEDRAFT_75109 [Dothistroma septosporum NZE10]